ncbi:MAG: TRAP transporter small permease [Solibacillus sp.]
MRKIIKVVDSIIDFSGILASICIFFTCFIVTWGVIARYFHIKVYWVEPVTIYMFIAISFLTISYTMKVNEHVRVDILTNLLPIKVRKILETILMMFCLGLFIYITKISYAMFKNSWLLKTKDLSIIQVPIWIPQSIVVIGWSIFVLSIMRYIWSIWYEDHFENDVHKVGDK